MSRFHWGWRIAIVYSLFALATLSFVFFAFTEDVGLVRDDYYQYSLDHDQRMQARQNAADLQGFSVDHGPDVVHVHMPMNHRPTNGRVEFYRPSSTTSDTSIPLSFDDAGTMTIPLQQFASGKWKVTVVWELNGTAYEREETIEVGS